MLNDKKRYNKKSNLYKMFAPIIAGMEAQGYSRAAALAAAGAYEVGSGAAMYYGAKYLGKTYKDSRDATTHQNKNLNYSQMATVPYQGHVNRKRNHQGWEGRAKKSKYGIMFHRFQKSKRAPIYRQPRGFIDTRVMVFKDIVTFAQSATDDKFNGRFHVEKIKDIEGLKRQLNLCEYARLEKIKVDFMVTHPQAILTTAELDEDAQLTSKAQYEKNNSLRIHRCYPDGKKYGRTLDLLQIDTHRNYTKNTGFLTAVSTSAYAAAIKVGMYDLPHNLKVTMIASYIVRFKGMADTTSLDNVNPS